MARNLLNISELKKHLGPGLGLRKNKYVIEIPIGKDFGRTVNFLCQATSLPERNTTTTYVWHKGRKYNMRGEVEFPGTFEISLVDSSTMELRKLFDEWLFLIDNTNEGRGQINPSNSLVKTNTIRKYLSRGDYKTTINIYQLDSTGTRKLYGYALQDAFPSSIGTVQLSDSEENSLTEFSLTFTYSEFVPIDGRGEYLGNLYLGQC